MMHSNHCLTAQLLCHTVFAHKDILDCKHLSFCKKTKGNYSICTLLHSSLQKEEKEDVTEAMISCDSLKANLQSLILKHSPQLLIQKYMYHLKPLCTTVLQIRFIYFILMNILSESFGVFKALFILEESWTT